MPSHPPITVHCVFFNLLSGPWLLWFLSSPVAAFVCLSPLSASALSLCLWPCPAICFAICYLFLFVYLFSVALSVHLSVIIYLRTCLLVVCLHLSLSWISCMSLSVCCLCFLGLPAPGCSSLSCLFSAASLILSAFCQMCPYIIPCPSGLSICLFRICVICLTCQHGPWMPMHCCLCMYQFPGCLCQSVLSVSPVLVWLCLLASPSHCSECPGLPSLSDRSLAGLESYHCLVDPVFRDPVSILGVCTLIHLLGHGQLIWFI